MKRILILILLAVTVLPAAAQVDRHDVRAGNRKFRKDKYKAAEVDYRKAALRDSTSVAAQYNLASSLYRQDNFDEAGKALDAVKEIVPTSGHEAEWQFNRGDVALQKKDYATAVDAFRHALILNPDDMDAKENYTYAKLMLKNRQDKQNGGNNNQNKDQDQDQNKDQDKNQDQNRNSDQNQDQNRNQGEQKISPQQAQQMLKAIQAKEKDTQDKVKKEKAALLKSRQRDKNW